MTDYSSNKCELGFSKIYEFALYVLPCFLILGSNSLLFVWMMAKVTCKNSLSRLGDRKVSTIWTHEHGYHSAQHYPCEFQVKYVLALAQVFNMVWCVTFPLLWFRTTRLLGQYLIASLVSTQGVLVLTVRCTKDAELKHRLSRLFRGLCTNSLLTLNSTNSNSLSKSSEL
jgi:hypothetical protein